MLILMDEDLENVFLISFLVHQIQSFRNSVFQQKLKLFLKENFKKMCGNTRKTFFTLLVIVDDKSYLKSLT